MGAGQFCTNPGIAVVVDGLEANGFAAATRLALAAVDDQTMLTDGIAQAFRDGCARIAGAPGVQPVLANPSERRNARPVLYEVSADDWLNSHALQEEVFGPLGLIVRARDAAQMQTIAENLQGQLTTSLHIDPADYPQAQALLPVLERKSGRVLANGFPTGVEVADAMVHGGPYPASTNFGATSVGTLSIRRFLRPVCYQNLPAALLPADLI